MYIFQSIRKNVIVNIIIQIIKKELKMIKELKKNFSNAENLINTKEIEGTSLQARIGVLAQILEHDKIKSIKDIKDRIPTDLKTKDLLTDVTPKKLTENDIQEQEYVLNVARIIHLVLKDIVKDGDNEDKKIFNGFVINIAAAEDNLLKMQNNLIMQNRLSENYRN